MKIAFFVLADLFAPLMTKMGSQLSGAYGATVDYISYLPKDHLLLKKTDSTFGPVTSRLTAKITKIHLHC